MDLDALKKRIDIVPALIATASGVLAALGGFKTEFVKLLDNPINWGWPEGLIAVGVLGVVLALVARSRRAKLSRLVQPDALWRQPQSPDQLIGRAQDLQLLLNQLVNPLVFLVSESGCGKSALLQAGVAVHPNAVAQYLPIYLDMSALDWADGPLRALRDGFNRALPPDDPARGTLNAASTPEHFAEVFSGFDRRTGRRILLLLDQFDDFQAQPRHRDRFLPPGTRVWRKANAIAGENPFWSVLGKAIEADSLHVVVAVRAEAAPGLDSIELRPNPPKFDLPRLPSRLQTLTS